jgi:uncharacterized phage protein gp47/JayE
MLVDLCTNVTKIPMKELATNTPSIRQAVKSEEGKIFIKEFPPSTITPSQLKRVCKEVSR